MRTSDQSSAHNSGTETGGLSAAVRSARDTVLAYIALTKPRVIELLLVAAIPAMLQADRGNTDHHVVLFFLTLIGGYLGAGSANSLNMVVDADIDKKMRRTERRPLARKVVSVRAALIFGLVLAVLSFLWLWLLADSLLAGILILITIAFYVVVYSMILKRRTAQNVVWGGAAGCMPVMVGWATVSDEIGRTGLAHWWQPLVLFMVIFFWTPPHTWALAMRYEADYRAAGVPMLPVVMERVGVTKRIVIYTWATVITTALLIPATGWIYAVGALGGGIWFLVVAHRIHTATKAGAEVKPLRLFILSNNYLSVVCVALSVDAVLGLQTVGDMLGWNLPG